jgi:hypothetical protein
MSSGAARALLATAFVAGLIFLAPIVLLGESLSLGELIVVCAVALGIGTAVRRWGADKTRRAGTAVAVAAGIGLLASVGLLVIALQTIGR